jgi:mono/diheme cytochrome c family protein
MRDHHPTRRRHPTGAALPTRRLPAILWAAGLAAAVALTACGDSATEPNQDVPASHTVSIGGALHDPGLNDPEVNCVGCHGATLEGGPDGQPSCFTCHGRQW